MGRQLVTVRVRMGGMPGKDRFCLRVVGQVGVDMVLRVMLFCLEMPLLVLRGVQFEMGKCFPDRFGRIVSRCHEQ